MTNYLDLACEYHGVDKGRVIKHRAQVGPDGSDDYSIIVDNGKLGCPKYYVPISLLDELAAQVKAPLVAEPLPVPAAVEFVYGTDLNYRELQDLAKELGIPANQKADELRVALESWLRSAASLDEEE